MQGETQVGGDQHSAVARRALFHLETYLGSMVDPVRKQSDAFPGSSRDCPRHKWTHSWA